MSDTQIPDDLRYTSEHEWIKVIDATTIRIGLTDYAQEQLGDIVFVDLPEVDTAVDAGAEFAEVESTKSVSDVYAPVAGRISAVNEELADHPETVNSDPYGAGWLIEIVVTDPADIGEGSSVLLDVVGYREVVESA